MGRGTRKSNERAKTSTLHLTPETPPETAIDTTPRCAPHRRRGSEETMKPSTADVHTQKDTTMHPSRRPPTPPHRQRHHLRPGEDGSAGSALPSTTCPTETNHQTEHSGGKRQSPLTPKAQRRAYEKHKDPQETRRRPTRLRAPTTSPENLLQRYDFSLALY